MPTDAEWNAPRKRDSLSWSARRARTFSVTFSNVIAMRRPASGNALTEKMLCAMRSSPYSTSPASAERSSRARDRRSTSLAGVAGSTSFIVSPTIDSTATPVAARSPRSRSRADSRRSRQRPDPERRLHVLDDLSLRPQLLDERPPRLELAELRITVLTNSAIRRVVSTASSSNASGVALTQRTPRTTPSR